VKYAPGTLRALGYKDGKEILTAKVETTGAPAIVPARAAPRRDQGRWRGRLRQSPFKSPDAQGRPVPTAADEITFTLSGPGKFIGVGNGDPSSHEPEQFLEAGAVWRRSLFNGLAQVIVQSTGQPGEIKLTAKASGLTEASVSISAAGTK
jgi:beta-galactosidase